MSTDPTIQISNNKARYLINPTNIIRFPEEDIPYKMLINFKEYVYTSSTAAGVPLIEQGQNINEINAGSVVLPLPLQLTDNTRVQLQETSSSVISFLSSIMSGNGFTGINSVEDLGKLGLDELQVYSKLIAGLGLGVLGSSSNILGKTGGTIATAAGALGQSDQASLLNGKAVNPFETMQFKQVNLKKHSFTWRLSPSSESESITLKNLINKIKGNILPSYVAAAGPTQYGAHALLKYPGIAHISFHGIDQNFYYKLKPAMIESFNVNYNNSDQLNVYRGGKPVMVELSMELSELSIHTADDYGGPTYEDIANPEYTANTVGAAAAAGIAAATDALGIASTTTSPRTGPTNGF